MAKVDIALKRWLACFHLKTSLRVPESLTRLDSQYGGVEVFIRNVPREPGEDYFLDLKFIVLAEDIEAAEVLAEETAAEITHTLSFVSAARVRVHKPVFLIDWEPGVEQRDQFVYGRYAVVDPMDTLDETMWETVKTVSEHEVTQAKRSALRWHTRATRAETLEDQFLYHFFAIEILASAETFPVKVVDTCPHCRGDLFCPNPECGKPEHRPLPKQKIRLLLLEVGLKPGLIDGLLELRNLLSHGEERPQIVAHMKKQGPDFEMEKAVARVADAASDAIHRALDIPDRNPPLTYYYMEIPENVTLTSRSHMRIGLPGDPFNPNIEDVWMAELSVIVTDPTTGAQEVVHAGGTKIKPPSTDQEAVDGGKRDQIR